MTFQEAVKSGRKMKRADWEHFYKLNDRMNFESRHGLLRVNLEDVMATDWQVEGGVTKEEIVKQLNDWAIEDEVSQLEIGAFADRIEKEGIAG